MRWRSYDFKHSRSKFAVSGQILKGKIFKCSFCAGKGILPGSSGTKCHVCRGSGEISVNGPVVVCAYCKGMGNYPVRTNLTCPVCRGKGVVPVKPPVDVCSECGGAGRVRGESMPCRKCRGSGVIHKKEEVQDEN